MCREVLPEFDSQNPPTEVFCFKCGARTSGETVLKRVQERMKIGAGF